MSGTTIVKLGGAAITKKDVFETLDEETLSSAALHLASVPGRLVVVHGAGSFGHFQAGEYGVSRGPITDARVLKGFCLTRCALARAGELAPGGENKPHAAASAAATRAASRRACAATTRMRCNHPSGRTFPYYFSIRCRARSLTDTRSGLHPFSPPTGRASVTQLNRMVVDALLRAGLPATGLSPCGAWSTSARQLTGDGCDQVEALLGSGLVPVLHGDAVLDEQLGCTILRSAISIRSLCHARPSQLTYGGCGARSSSTVHRQLSH